MRPSLRMDPNMQFHIYMRIKLFNISFVLLALTLFSVTGETANCPTPQQERALRSRMFTNRLLNLSVRCGQLSQYQALRNQHRNYFDNQLKAIYSFYGNDRGVEESQNLDQASAEARNRITSDPSACESTENTLSRLRSQTSDVAVDEIIQQDPNSSIAPIAGCSVADSESLITPPSEGQTGSSTPAPANQQEATPTYITPFGGDLPTSTPVSNQITPEHNAGTGALKIIASLYANVPGINRCAPMEPNYIYRSRIQSLMSDLERPRYTQSSERNPVFSRVGNELQMSLVSSDCSSFAAAAIGAGGLKIKKNQEINELGNMPSTETMINWYHNPENNNCFEIVQFNNNNPAIQVGDLYVNRGSGSHVVVITGVASTADPLGFTTIRDANGNITTLPELEHIKASDCSDSGTQSLLGKLARGGDGNASKVVQAQSLGNDQFTAGPYVSYGVGMHRKLLELACRAHFSSTSIPAFVREDGTDFALFRVKRNPDGNVVEACKSTRNIVPKSYSAVQQCFAH